MVTQKQSSNYKFQSEKEQSVVEFNIISPEERKELTANKADTNQIEEQGEQYKSFTSNALDKKLKAILEEARRPDSYNN